MFSRNVHDGWELPKFWFIAGAYLVFVCVVLYVPPSLPSPLHLDWPGSQYLYDAFINM